jgi:hypothetical protein
VHVVNVKVGDDLIGHFNGDAIRRIQADLKGGDDHLLYGNLERRPGPTSESLLTGGKSAILNLGEGNDHCTLRFDAYRFVNYETGQWRGGYLSTISIAVLAGGGDDKLEGSFAPVYDGPLAVAAYMGSGNDSADIGFDGHIHEPEYRTGGGGSATFRLFGEGGDDDLSVQAGRRGDFDPVPARVQPHTEFSVYFNGGSGNDEMAFEFGGVLEGRLNLFMSGEGGNDRFDVDLVLKGRSNGWLHAQVWGGSGDDWFEFELYDLGLVNIESALIVGGDGYDRAPRRSHQVDVVGLDFDPYFDPASFPSRGGAFVPVPRTTPGTIAGPIPAQRATPTN